MNHFFVSSLKSIAAGLTAAAMLTGCALWGGHDPLKTLSYQAESSKNTNLIVFLRGRGGSHDDFAKEGFVQDVRRRNLPYDMIAPDAHIGYYFSETLVPRLKEDVINPAKAQGYKRIWLVGVSMGGLGAMMYLRSHPEDVAGVYLISPFLGYDDIIKEITDAGGVRSWSPGIYEPDDDWERMFWDWLKEYAENPSAWPPVYLGYGTEDEFVPAHKLMGDILPKDHIYETSGGHVPEAMKRVWNLFLDDKVLLNFSEQ